MENPTDVILVPRLAGKIRSNDCHMITDHMYLLHTLHIVHTCDL